MSKNERGAGLPWQTRLMHPPRGKPHARVIVKIAGSHQLVREIVDRPVSGFGLFNAVDGRVLPDRIKVPKKIAPHLGAQGQPQFSVTPPIHILNKLFHSAERVDAQSRGDHFFLGDQAVTDPRRKQGNGWVAWDDVILAARSTAPAFTGGIVGFGRRVQSLLPASWLEGLPKPELAAESSRRQWQMKNGLPGRALLLVLGWNLLGGFLGSIALKLADRAAADSGCDARHWIDWLWNPKWRN